MPVSEDLHHRWNLPGLHSMKMSQPDRISQFFVQIDLAEAAAHNSSGLHDVGAAVVKIVRALLPE